MKVPTLSGQTVAAQPIPNGYQPADVSALSQGGGVGGGLSSLGGAFADEAFKAKKQADQVLEFEATADINDQADVLYQDFASKDGPAAMQAYEGLLPAYDQAVSERLSRITSEDARAAAEQNARLTRGSLVARSTVRADGVRWDMATDSNKRLLGSLGRSVALAVANGGVRVSQTPSLPESQQAKNATGSDAPHLLDERVLAPSFAAAHEANVKFAEANADQLPTDQASYVTHADALWKEDAYKSVMDGLLTRGDDRTAKAFFEKHKAEFAADDIDNLQGAVNRASEIGTSQRVASEAIATHANDPGTWTEKQDAMLKLAGDDAGAAKAVRAWIKDGREAETARYNDATTALLESVDGGAPAADVAMAASVMPLEYREAISKALDNRSKRVVVESQSDFYLKWSTMAAGFDPETGKADPAMREAFLAHNFVPDIPNASKDDWGHLRALQKEGAGGGKETTSLISDTEIAAHIIDITAPELEGVDKSTRLYVVQRELDALWAAERGDGPELTPTRKQELADELTAGSVFDRAGFGGNTGGNLSVIEALEADPETLDIGDIDEGVVGTLRSQLAAAGIVPASDADIARAYQRMIRAGLLSGGR